MGFTDPDWLDTGCGTGTLARRVMEERSDVKFTLCDPSEKMLTEAKGKLADSDIRFFNISSQQLTFESEFDVVTAVQSHHYLKSDAIALTRWSQFLVDHGNSTEDVQMHLDRRGTEVFPITIEMHINLLRECGFRSVDLLWTSYLQAGFWAVK